MCYYKSVVFIIGVGGWDIMSWKDRIINHENRLVKYSVICIISLILIVFFIISIKFCFSAGSALGELIYNIKH